MLTFVYFQFVHFNVVLLLCTTRMPDCSQIPTLAAVLTTMSPLLCHQYGVHWLKVKVSIFTQTIFRLFADSSTTKAISIMAKYTSKCFQGFSVLCLEMTLVGDVIGLDVLSYFALSISKWFFGGNLLKTLASCSLAACLLALDANSVGVGWISNGVVDFPGQ